MILLCPKESFKKMIPLFGKQKFKKVSLKNAKKPFFLVEILCAFFLTLVFCTSMFSICQKVHQDAQNKLQEIHKKRLVYLGLADCVENYLKTKQIKTQKNLTLFLDAQKTLNVCISSTLEKQKKTQTKGWQLYKASIAIYLANTTTQNHTMLALPKKHFFENTPPLREDSTFAKEKKN